MCRCLNRPSWLHVMEEASFSVHILVSRPQHARGGGGQHGPEAFKFVLACMSVQCVDPSGRMNSVGSVVSGRMNSVGSVVSCVNRNKVGPGCAWECDEY